jgi:hypothetical protein
MTIRAVDPVTRRPLPEGEIGELAVCSYVTPGYYRAPELYPRCQCADRCGDRLDSGRRSAHRRAGSNQHYRSLKAYPEAYPGLEAPADAVMMIVPVAEPAAALTMAA